MLRRHGFQVAVGLAVVAVVSAFLWDLFQYGGATVVKAADDVYSTGVPVAAALACLIAGWRRQGRPRASWLLLGASAFLWGTGSATWFYYDVVTQQGVPFPSLADAGFLLAVPFAFAGLMLFPSASSRTTSQFRTLLDGSIIASALLFVSWATVLGPSYSQMRDQRPVGVEALVRWRHPERGLVMPMTFIPLAEKTGGIVAIGRWVLREACRQMQHWRQRYPELQLSVNLSGRQMRDPGLVADLAGALQDTGLPAHALTLEMTESVLMDDIFAKPLVAADLAAYLDRPAGELAA